MKLFELILDDETLTGVTAISLVDKPAMESDFIAFNEDLKRVTFKTVDEEKRIVTGLVLIPDKPIYRTNNEEGYYVYLSKDTINRASQIYLKQNKTNNATLQHESEVDGVHLVESWIVSDPKMDKVVTLGIEAESGSWAASMLIENDEVWNDYVKTGKVKGFSIEAMFKQRPTDVQMSVEDLVELKKSFEKNTP
jgi:activator of 2-hydroxyglutaryl-CoA dehydratase